MLKWSSLSTDLKFRRDDEGRIVMRLGGEQTYLSRAFWLQFLTQLTKDGETPENLKKVKELF